MITSNIVEGQKTKARKTWLITFLLSQRTSYWVNLSKSLDSNFYRKLKNLQQVWVTISFSTIAFLKTIRAVPIILMIILKKQHFSRISFHFAMFRHNLVIESKITQSNHTIITYQHLCLKSIAQISKSTTKTTNQLESNILKFLEILEQNWVKTRIFLILWLTWDL